jgi:hypothetical protein
VEGYPPHRDIIEERVRGVKRDDLAGCDILKDTTHEKCQ